MASIGVFGIIFDEDGGLLCVKMNYGRFGWTTPGGRVEVGESPISALKREILEETGFDALPTELIGVYSKPYEDDIVLCFECIPLGRDKWNPTEEISEVRFFPPSELPDEMSFVARTRVLDGIDRKRNVVRVFQDPNTLCAI